MQEGHFAQQCGETQLTALAHFLSTSTLDDDGAGVLRDGTEPLVGILAIVGGEELAEVQIRSQRSKVERIVFPRRGYLNRPGVNVLR